jgi:hypothetical protein
MRLSLHRRLFTAAASLLPMLAASGVRGEPKSQARKIVGTWKVVEATARDGAGALLPKPYGPLGMGLVTFNAAGRMMAVLCDGRSAIPAGEERDYASYCGNYSFDGSTLVTRVDASSGGRLAIGGDQVRKVRFEGKRMVLVPPPLEKNGVTLYREIFWERISPLSA